MRAANGKRRGVYWSALKGRWVVRGMVEGRDRHLGTFGRFDDAVADAVRLGIRKAEDDLEEPERRPAEWTDPGDCYLETLPQGVESSGEMHLRRAVLEDAIRAVKTGGVAAKDAFAWLRGEGEYSPGYGCEDVCDILGIDYGAFLKSLDQKVAA